MFTHSKSTLHIQCRLCATFARWRC